MERILHYEIKASDDSPTVACFLKRQGYSSANLTDLKKMPESILINGTPSYMIRHLQGGDRLTVHIQETAVSEKIPPVYHPLDIVYEDEDLIVINKPADLPIHPSMRNYTHSLANGLAWYFAQKDCPFVFRCINRLDHNTSGLTIIAKHLVSGSILATMVRNREIHREYLGISRGRVTPSSGTITAPLGRKDGSIIERTIDFEHGESAITHYEVLEEKNGHSLIRLTLETGIAHYWSRSRKSLWKKGETSGNLQTVVEMRTDCDQDALWLKVKVAGNGPTCHTDRHSCFYRVVNVDGNHVVLHK